MAIDKGFGRDMLGVGVRAPLTDGGVERTTFTVRKWDIDQLQWTRAKFGIDPRQRTVPEACLLAAKVSPFEVTEDYCNLVTRAGWAQLFKSVITGGATLFSGTVGRIGIGTGVTAVAATDTALTSIASMTGNNWNLCGAPPTVNTGVTPCTIVFTATFATTDAVGAWNEFAIDQGTAAAASVTATAPMINHSLLTTSTKNNTQQWSATATLSFT